MTATAAQPKSLANQRSNSGEKNMSITYQCGSVDTAIADRSS